MLRDAFRIGVALASPHWLLPLRIVDHRFESRFRFVLKQKLG